eukprot:548439-Rhodomonas_salina.1
MWLEFGCDNCAFLIQPGHVRYLPTRPLCDVRVRCAVCLRARDAISGTDIAVFAYESATRCPCYAVSGTEIAYGAARRQRQGAYGGMHYGDVGPYPPTRLLSHVRYWHSGMCLRECYATDIVVFAYESATRCPGTGIAVFAYARATRCPVLSWGIVLLPEGHVGGLER